jgi:cytoskeletal protein CcmA (bactofilin family)
MLRGHSQKKTGAVPQDRAAGGRGGTVLIVGPDDARTEGIIFSGTVQVDGCVEGDVRCNRLVVTRYGRIDGAVSAHSVTIDGTVNGPIDAARIFLGPTASIKGNLTYEALNVATGASIAGFCRDRGRPTTRAPGCAASGGSPVLAFNPTKLACRRIAPAAASAAPEHKRRPSGLSMKAVWETYERNSAGSAPKPAARHGIASLTAAHCAAS